MSTAVRCTGVAPVVVINASARAGVRKTPSRFEADALAIAPGTLPPASEVKPTEACTVEGTRQRNSTPG